MEKKFNKVRFFQILGFLTKRLNPRTLKLESSLPLTIYSYLSLISKTVHCIKIPLSLLWPQQDLKQLYVGSLFNYLDDQPRYWMSLTGFVFLSWAISIHLSFVSNAKKNCRPLYRWMKITMELPTNGETEIDQKVVGLTAEENRRFWEDLDKFNSRYIRFMNAYLVLTWIVFDVQLFLVRFDVDLWLYILVQALQIVNGNYFMWIFFQSMYTINVFLIESILFLGKKFRHLSKKVQNLRSTKTKLAHNLKLAKLIRDYNEVLKELIDINDFFKEYLGHNLIHLYAITVSVTLLTLFMDLRLKLFLNLSIIFFYLVIIAIPFHFANNVTVEISRARRSFETVSFHPYTSLRNRQKIELIYSLSDNKGWTCFDWFVISSRAALVISLELATNLLLLFQAYFFAQMTS